MLLRKWKNSFLLKEDSFKMREQGGREWKREKEGDGEEREAVFIFFMFWLLYCIYSYCYCWCFKSTHIETEELGPCIDEVGGSTQCDLRGGQDPDLK